MEQLLLEKLVLDLLKLQNQLILDPLRLKE